MTPGAVLDPMYCQWGTYTMLCRTLIRKLTIFLCGYSIVLNAQLAPSLVLMDSAGFGEFAVIRANVCICRLSGDSVNFKVTTSHIAIY